MSDLKYSYTNEPYPIHKPVPVICSFDSEGHIRPMYVRINGEAYKIQSSTMVSSFFDSAEYQCQVEDHGLLKLLTLEYRYREHLWLMPK